MKNFSAILDAFFKGIARSRVSLIGAMITTVSFPFLLGLVVIDSWYHISNPYLGAIIYMVLGPAFMFGLVLVFIGLFFLKGKEEVRLFTVGYLKEHFSDETKFNRVRKLIFLGVMLTCANFVIFALLGYSGYHYLESNHFCGQFCHTVMHPEYTAYQNSPHSRVGCVECHIGSGATWFVKSKISGARQLFAVALDTYPRPIKTPVHGLRPARETCEACHRPDLFHGDKLFIKNKYEADEQNSHTQTVMLMRIGAASGSAKAPHGIHWHAAKENQITYDADPSRLIIPEVRLTGADGKVTVYRSEDALANLKQANLPIENRLMDCVDCHNRPTHIYRSAATAIDEKIFSGEIPEELPFIKQQALAAITGEFQSNDDAMVKIAEQLGNWYQSNYAELAKSRQALIDKAIKGVQTAFSQNVFPEMNIEWGTYVNHIGHGENFDIGCFRCHDGTHVSEDGKEISSDCNTCHAVLAEDEKQPEILKTLQGI